MGEDGRRKAGGGKEGATKREDWMAADSNSGPACFREVLRYGAGTRAEADAIGRWRRLLGHGVVKDWFLDEGYYASRCI